jgi:hypothetical protein
VKKAHSNIACALEVIRIACIPWPRETLNFLLKGVICATCLGGQMLFLSLVVLFLACCTPAEMTPETGVYIISVLILALSPPSAAAIIPVGSELRFFLYDN